MDNTSLTPQGFCRRVLLSLYFLSLFFSFSSVHLRTPRGASSRGRNKGPALSWCGEGWETGKERRLSGSPCPSGVTVKFNSYVLFVRKVSSSYSRVRGNGTTVPVQEGWVQHCSENRPCPAAAPARGPGPSGSGERTDRGTE